MVSLILDRQTFDRRPSRPFGLLEDMGSRLTIDSAGQRPNCNPRTRACSEISLAAGSFIILLSRAIGTRLGASLS